MPKPLGQVKHEGRSSSEGSRFEIGSTRFDDSRIIPAIGVGIGTIIALYNSETIETRTAGVIIALISLSPLFIRTQKSWAWAGAAITLVSLAGLSQSQSPLAAWPLALPAPLFVGYGSRQISNFRLFSRLSVHTVVYALTVSAVTLITSTKHLAPTDRLPFLLNSPERILPFVWPAFSILTAYYLNRLTQLVRLNAQTVFRMQEILSELDSTKKAIWTELAEIMHRRLNVEWLFIIVPETPYFVQSASATEEARQNVRLVIAGVAGSGASTALRMSFTMGDGLSWRAVRDRAPVVSHDVQTEDKYVHIRGIGARSEMIVPIFDVDRPDVLLALVCAQSSTKGYFRNTARQRAIIDFTAHVEEFLGSSRDILGFHRRLRTAIEGSSALTNFDDLVERMLAVAHDLFRPLRVQFVRLGLGTTVPLDSTSLGAKDDALTALLLPRRAKSHDPVSDCLQKWLPCYLDFATDSGGLPTDWTEWANANHVGSVAIIPVGEKHKRLGLLVAAFEARVRSPWPLLLKTFTETFSTSLLAAWYDEGIYHRFLRPHIDLHRFMAEAKLSRGTIDRRLKDAVTVNPDLAEVLQGVREVVNRFYALDASKPPDLKTRKLEAVLRDLFNSDLVARYPGSRVLPRIDPLIEEESFPLKLVIFRFVTEAVINALAHGKAEEIFVRIFRLRWHADIVIGDLGLGFDPETLTTWSGDPGGLIGTAQDMALLCGAGPLQWHWTAKNRGTVVSIRIPLLASEAAPEERTVADWRDEMERTNDWRTKARATE